MSELSNWLGPAGTCVVICGGRGSRLMPLSSDTAKSLVKVGQRTILEIVLTFWRRHVDRFVFVLNLFKEDLVTEIQRLGVEFDAVEEQGPPRGIARALGQVQHLVNGRFVTVLGDCLCRGSFEVARGADLGIGVARGVGPEIIHQNYSVEVAGDRVARVVEKPEVVRNDLCGTGFYFFDERIFSAVERTAPSPKKGVVELTDAIQTLIDDEGCISPFYLDGDYLNLTFPADVERAGHLFGDRDESA